MDDEVQIRAARREDASPIARVFLASFGTLTFLPKLHTDEEAFGFIANTVMAEQEVMVAEMSSEIAGFLAMGNGVFVEHLYVHPDYQRRGIGGRLLQGAQARMPDGFRLWVFQENVDARRFYERRGLRVIELTDGAGNEEHTPDALYEWRPET